MTGPCGIPSSASAVSLNVTVVGSTAGGFLVLFPAGTTVPGVSLINYRSGQTRANNAVVPFGVSGNLTIHSGQPAGTTHFLIDVNGYFQ